MSASSLVAGLLALAVSPPVSAVPSPIGIGLLEATEPFGNSLAAGAEMAVAEVNAEGGIEGRPLRLFRLPAARPWRDFASLSAELLAERDPVVLVGPTDGTAAHLAAQLATRKRVPVVTLSSEASLTRSSDPWVFQGVPDDEEQARSVLEWALPEPRGKRAVIAVQKGRAGQQRLRSLERACRHLGVDVISVLQSETPLRQESDVLLLWLDVEAALRFLVSLEKVSAPEIILGPFWLDDQRLLEGLPRSIPQLAFPLLRSGRQASPGEALGYDMIRVVAEAARRAGSDPARIRQGLSAGQRHVGRSGTFRFDRQGSRKGKLAIAAVKRGRTSFERFDLRNLWRAGR